MRVETLLPLGKLDPGLRAAETPLDLARIGDDARLVERLGYDGLAVEETKDDPYVVMALAAHATARLRLTTAVAMAFPRSPTITAMSAWTIQKLSRGRFVLGLGSQVRGHIVRRFGLDYRPPGPWKPTCISSRKPFRHWRPMKTGWRKCFWALAPKSRSAKCKTLYGSSGSASNGRSSCSSSKEAAF